MQIVFYSVVQLVFKQQQAWATQQETTTMKRSVHQERLRCVLLAWILAAAKISSAMNANPRNLQVEQCVEWSKTIPQQAQTGLRGVDHPGDDYVCVKTKIIVLRQHGNAMLQWITDEDGASVLSTTVSNDHFNLPYTYPHTRLFILATLSFHLLQTTQYYKTNVTTGSTPTWTMRESCMLPAPRLESLVPVWVFPRIFTCI